MKVARLLVVILLGFGPALASARAPVYFTLYAGGETHDVEYQFAQPLDLDLDDNGDTYGFGVGYEITDHWIMQLNYTYSDAEQVTVEQVILSLNYKFPFLFKGMHGFIGVLGGEGRLEWEHEPDFSDNLVDDTEGKQSVLGAQVGLSYDISESWSSSLTYQYLDQEFKTHFLTDSGRLNFFHDSFQYLLFGVSYHF